MSLTSHTKTLGITGCIGAGKSVLSTLLRLRDIPVFDTDSCAKSLYDSDPKLKCFIVDRFGEALYETDEGKLDKQLLASIIFADAEALADVERVVHQRTLEAFCRWREEQKTPWCAIESALLYKAALFLEQCDAVAEVTAPLELCVARVQRRDNASKEAVLARLGAQTAPLKSSFPRPIFLILNNDSTPLMPQVASLVKSLAV